MHDDRLLVEGRLTRAMNQFIRPAIYADRVPLGMSVWHVETGPLLPDGGRGRPVPVGQALNAWSNGSFEPFSTGTRWGPPWSTSWFRLEGTVPAAWAGRRVEAVIDPGFGDDAPLVPHPEAALEPVRQDAPSHLLVGGHRRHPGLHPLPARRHLQLTAVGA
jgi:alpha-mannosidase